MSGELNKLSPQERLKAENEFLKMKLMLENGASFHVEESGIRIPPEMGNHFLNYIAEVVKQSENAKCITVFEKIGQPAFFKPVTEIDDSEISKAWKELSDYLEHYGIGLDVHSPNISERELYRFATEELFGQEVDDMDIPGTQTCFIYDEFHPDPVYDNTIQVKEDLLNDIFGKQDLFFRIHYAKEGFSFNSRFYPVWEEYFEKIKRFKTLFDEIRLVDSDLSNCTVKEGECRVEGSYQAIGTQAGNSIIFKGAFDIRLKIGYLEYWEFVAITLEGFNIE
ncbi:MAG: hypothetical protein ABIR30_06495 [Chitinophagaceae bacterium]